MVGPVKVVLVETSPRTIFLLRGDISVGAEGLLLALSPSRMEVVVLGRFV